MLRCPLIMLLLVLYRPVLAEPLGVPGGALEINWESRFTSQEKSKLRLWLEHAASSASLINGNFPMTRTNVLIHRTKRGAGPVPWAHTIRHTEPQGVAFHVNPELGLTAFKTDWTATHEFSHLFLPYPGQADIWISEGFASYYQHILMMRKGTLDEQQGWQKIVDGFGRGEADPNQNISLKQASQEMRQRRAFKRVYWSGALYFLEADLVLRQQGKSLDEVVSKFLLCCRDKSIQWDGMSIAVALDQATDGDLFVPLYRRYEVTTSLPDYRAILSQVGVSIEAKHAILSHTNDSQRLLRSAISSPR
jgi:hypothetical protein